MTSIFIKTYGCALNQSDSEVMLGLLKKAKFEIAQSIDCADVVIINTCTVKNPTERKFFNYLDKIKDMGKQIIIAGCIPQTNPEKVGGYSLIGVSQISNIVEIVEEAINGNAVESLSYEKFQRLNLPKIRRNPIIEIVPICAGCLGEPCAYCKVKSARGDLVSYQKEDILRQIRSAVRDEVKEVWITAQDTGCYGKDIGENLISLLKEVLEIDGDFKVRLGMLNPNHALEFLDDLIKIYKNEKMFKFLHVPVQSGSDKILKSMRRKYTAEDFKKIIYKFTREIPDITIATDVICGFPGETEEDFNATLELIKEIKPDAINISRFWPRQGTEAEKMENPVHGQETKRRSTILTDIYQSTARMRNERWFDWQGKIIIDEIGKDNTMIGRNYAYKPVVVLCSCKIGDVIEVKIMKVTPFDLRGAKI
jgi:MiaB-like tRNA modifying enzyme